MVICRVIRGLCSLKLNLDILSVFSTYGIYDCLKYIHINAKQIFIENLKFSSNIYIIQCQLLPKALMQNIKFVLFFSCNFVQLFFVFFVVKLMHIRVVFQCSLGIHVQIGNISIYGCVYMFHDVIYCKCIVIIYCQMIDRSLYIYLYRIYMIWSVKYVYKTQECVILSRFLHVNMYHLNLFYKEGSLCF